jgi:DNA (cytosine-5)-methyltransferase 1
MGVRYAVRENLSARIVASRTPVNTTRGKDKARERPIAVDLFCGVGGFSLGFEQAGYDVIAAVDAEKRHVDTYLRNFPSCNAQCIDLSFVSGDQLREKVSIGNKHIDVVFAGPPCQGFSLIGKRLREDPRNLLLYELARLIAELAPSYFVVENVAGILLGNAKRVLDEFVRKVEGAGYTIVKPFKLLDGVEFGVPQRRRRVFILGYIQGTPAPQYPKPSHPYVDAGKYDGPTVWDAIGDLPRVGDYKYLLETDGYRGNLGTPSAYAKVLRGESSDPEDLSPQRKRNGDGLSGCMRTLHTSETITRFKNTQQGCSEEVSRFYRLHKNGFAPTLRAGTGPAQGSFMAPRPIHPFQNRCITVREAARLHSFPDWFYFHSTKWHGFRQIGNSVPPLLARAVAKSVRLALEEI